MLVVFAGMLGNLAYLVCPIYPNIFFKLPRYLFHNIGGLQIILKLNKGWLISKLNKEISDHELRLKEYRLNDVVI